MMRLGTFIVSLVLALAANAYAQIRVVTYNTLRNPNSVPDANFTTVFSAIASSSVNGIARRPDIISLQDQDSTSTGHIEAILDGLFGGTYVAVQPPQKGSNRLAFAYNSSTVQLIGGIASISNQAATRPQFRAQFRAIANPRTSFYVYNSHLKAGNTQGDATTRAIETMSLRAVGVSLTPTQMSPVGPTLVRGVPTI